jgi:hypothetical protein
MAEERNKQLFYVANVLDIGCQLKILRFLGGATENVSEALDAYYMGVNDACRVLGYGECEPENFELGPILIGHDTIH